MAEETEKDPNDTPRSTGKPGKRAQKTIEKLNIAEVGGQLLNPLLSGLMESRAGEDTIPLGTDIHHAASFVNPAMRRHFRAGGENADNLLPPVSSLSALTKAVEVLHGQVVDIGFRLGELVDKDALPTTPENVQAYINSFDSAPIGIAAGDYVYAQPRVPEEQRQPHYPKRLAACITPDELPEVPLRFKIDGEDKRILIKNIPIGPRGHSLAHILLALGFVGSMLKSRQGEGEKAEESEFILRATGGAVRQLPPIEEKVYTYLAQQLKENGYPRPDDILEASGCSLNHGELRTALEDLLPYAEIYHIARRLRGGTGSDPFGEALRKVKVYTGKSETEPTCRDGYECAILLGGMLQYGLANADKETRHALSDIEKRFMQKVHHTFHNLGADDALPSAEEILQWPESQKIVEGFGEGFAGQFFLEKNTAAAQQAWATKLRTEKAVRGADEGGITH